MIAGIFHRGSGIGNQLHRYVMTRTKAADLGVPFGMVNPEGFKGSSFMSLDMGVPVEGSFAIEEPSGRVVPQGHGLKVFSEKRIEENGVDVRGYDPEINFIEDDTLIDGEFQDERYFKHHMYNVKQWLRVAPLGMPNDVCVIGFRGGEFSMIPELFLPESYWEQAIIEMQKINPAMKFSVVTDDPDLAHQFFPPVVKIFHDVETDWRMIRHANYLIIANSSFYILPALLNDHAKKIIAPRYWARRNTGVWALPQNFYGKFHYI